MHEPTTLRCMRSFLDLHPGSPTQKTCHPFFRQAADHLLTVGCRAFHGRDRDSRAVESRDVSRSAVFRRTDCRVECIFVG